MKILVPLLLPTAILIACTTPPQITPPTPHDVYVKASPDQLWTALLTLLTDSNIPIANMDRASWFLRTEEIRLGGEADSVVDCGKDMGSSRANLGSVDVAMRFTVLLRPATDSTGIRIQTAARAWDRVNASLRASGNVFAGNPNVQCVSRGTAEERLVTRLMQRVGME